MKVAGVRLPFGMGVSGDGLIVTAKCTLCGWQASAVMTGGLPPGETWDPYGDMQKECVLHIQLAHPRHECELVGEETVVEETIPSDEDISKHPIVMMREAYRERIATLEAENAQFRKLLSGVVFRPWWKRAKKNKGA